MAGALRGQNAAVRAEPGYLAERSPRWSKLTTYDVPFVPACLGPRGEGPAGRGGADRAPAPAGMGDRGTHRGRVVDAAPAGTRRPVRAGRPPRGRAGHPPGAG